MLNELLYSLFAQLEWHEDEDAPDLDDGQENMQEIAYLCLIDWQHFNPKLTAMPPRFEICYPSGMGWMSHDDLGLSGPVKCVRAWARI
jgi:hypothetical protein